MRIPTLAVCTLATIAAQSPSHETAHALPAPEPTPEAAPRISHPAAVALNAAALNTGMQPEPANTQVEFSRPTPTVAQTTTLDELEAPTEPVPQPSKITDPQVPTPSPAPTSPPGSSQYLQEPPEPQEPPELQEQPAAPSSPSAPMPAPAPAPLPAPAPATPSNSTPAPSSAPVPTPSGLRTEPIAPTVQIGNVTLPHRGALPANFAFPIRVRVTVDPAITTNTPITDTTSNLAAWEERIRACLDAKPQIYATGADGSLIPILFDGQQGEILRNANGRMVCTAIR